MILLLDEWWRGFVYNRVLRTKLKLAPNSALNSQLFSKGATVYQQITLIGNVGSPPEMRYTPAGTAVTNFSLAVNRRWTNADGQAQEKTTWFRISTWQRQAEIANQYLAKGRRVMIIGEVEEARAFTDRDGNHRASIEVRAFDIKFLDGRSQDQDGAGAPTSADKSEAQEAPAGDIPF